MTERQLIERQRQEALEKNPPIEYPPRIAAMDPGKQQDYFALVGIEVIGTKIRIIGATQWLHQEYETVEEEIKIINDTLVKRKFDWLVVETNQVGWHVVSALKKKGLPVMPITTGGKITDPKKKILGNTMHKNEHVTWLIRKIKNGDIMFPPNPSPGTIKLMNQLPKFSRKKTEAGNITYSAQGAEHDDLVMALILATYVARKKYMRDTIGNVAMTSGNYAKQKKYSRVEDYMPEYLGSFARVTDIRMT